MTSKRKRSYLSVLLGEAAAIEMLAASVSYTIAYTRHYAECFAETQSSS